MSILSDREIRHHAIRESESFVKIHPFIPEHVQPASIDLTLGDEWAYYMYPGEPFAMAEAKSRPTGMTVGDHYALPSRHFVLATTREYIELPDDIVGRVEGKSSLARAGLLIHLTAGYVDPGFKGKITLEVYNVNEASVTLEAGKKFCQLSLETMSQSAEFPYGHEKLGSKYQDQKAVTTSRYAG